MATSRNVFCGPCEAQHITKSAVNWCPECEEGLCTECQKHHSVSKGTRGHGVISVGNYKKMPTAISEVVHHCQDHNMRHQMYCPYHDQICCPLCVSTNHQKCTDLKAISELIKRSKESTLLAVMDQSLQDIKNNINRVIRNRKDNLSAIGSQREKFIDGIKQMRIKINSHLDRLEQEITNEWLTAEKEAKDKIETFLRQVLKAGENVDELQNNVLAIKEYASDLQTFFGSKAIEAELDKVEKYMESLNDDKSLKELRLKFTINENVSNMMSHLTSFGRVFVADSKPLVVLKPVKEKHAQIMAVLPQPSKKTIHDIKVSLVSKVHYPKEQCDMRGCVSLTNGKLVLADGSYNGGLLILNSDDSFYKNINVEGSYQSYDVTSIHETLLAVSTNNGIKLIDMDTGTTVKRIRTNNNYNYGITNHKQQLFWCEKSLGILTVELSSDNRITTIVKDKSTPKLAYIAACSANIYTTNPENQTVSCYEDNKKLWDFTDPSMFQSPEGVTLDNDNNVFITSYADSKVIVISPFGTEGRIILTEADGIKQPRGIDFDKVRNILVVVNNNGTVFKFNISYT